MPIPKLVQIESWSYSRYDDYAKCPAFAKYKHLDKIPDPRSEAGGPAMERGTMIHAISSVIALNGKVVADKNTTPAVLKRMNEVSKAWNEFKTIPVELFRFEKEFRLLARQKAVQAEQLWGFDREWNLADWLDWKRCWLRVKVDTYFIVEKLREMSIIDYKSGKVAMGHAEQRSLYALAAFLRFPEVDTVEAGHWYLDQGVEHHEVWTRKHDFKRLKKEWNGRIKGMIADKKFKPKPSEYACKWCPYRKSEGGPCAY